MPLVSRRWSDAQQAERRDGRVLARVAQLHLSSTSRPPALRERAPRITRRVRITRSIPATWRHNSTSPAPPCPAAGRRRAHPSRSGTRCSWSCGSGGTRSAFRSGRDSSVAIRCQGGRAVEQGEAEGRYKDLGSSVEQRARVLVSLPHSRVHYYLNPLTKPWR